MSALREAVASVEEKIDAECQDAPAPCFEENDYEAGYIAGLAFAQDLLRELLKAHPDAAPEYEWGEGPDQFDGHIVPRMSEATARHTMKHRHDYGVESYVFRRQVGPWERAE